MALVLLLILSALGHPSPSQAQVSVSVDSLVAAWRESTLKSGLGDRPYCFDLGDLSVAMDPGIDEARLRKLLSAMPQLESSYAPAYQLANRWFSTATDGFVFDFSAPITVTYSFVPDGTFIPGGNLPGEPDGPSDLNAVMDANFPGGRAAWRAEFAKAFDEWGRRLNVTFIEVGDDGAAFPNSGGSLGSRGDIRIGGHFIDGSGSGFLAFNYFPNNGDMVIDTANVSFLTDPADDFRNLRNLLAHESGHGIGLRHVDPRNSTKVMEAIISDAFDGAQEDDIRGAQRHYGDRFEPNESAAAAADLGALPLPVGGEPVPVVLEDLALEDNGENDYYRFSVPGGARLDIELAPVGTTYQQGPEGGSVAPVDALRIHDPAFQILAPDASTVLVTVDAAGAGGAEGVGDFELGEGAGDYFLRVFAPTATNDLQRYTLSLGFSAPISEPTPTPTPLPGETTFARHWSGYE